MVCSKTGRSKGLSASGAWLGRSSEHGQSQNWPIDPLPRILYVRSGPFCFHRHSCEIPSRAQNNFGLANAAVEAIWLANALACRQNGGAPSGATHPSLKFIVNIWGKRLLNHGHTYNATKVTFGDARGQSWSISLQNFLPKKPAGLAAHSAGLQYNLAPELPASRRSRPAAHSAGLQYTT